MAASLLRRGEKIPGFGHFVYRSGDPRAVVLLGLVRRAAPKSGQLAVAEAVLAEVRRKSLPEPDIDFAVATLARVAGMGSRAGEAVFAVACTAGWIAHALEAYAGGGGPLRPRAVYTGRLRSSTHDAAAVCYRFVTWHRSVRRDLNVSQIWKPISPMSSAARGPGLSGPAMTRRPR